MTVDASTGAATPASAIPDWLPRDTLCADAAVIRRAFANASEETHDVTGGLPTPSISLVSSRDEHDVLRNIERRIAETFVFLPGHHGLMQQLLYYPPTSTYPPHADCREDRDGASLAAGGTSVDERAFTTLAYCTDAGESSTRDDDGATAFPALGVRVAPRVGQLAVWQNLDDDTGACDARSTHEATVLSSKPRVVLQRWYERGPTLPPPNRHSVTSTRCGLDEAGRIESCRTYCATEKAARAAEAMHRALETWQRYQAVVVDDDDDHPLKHAVAGHLAEARAAQPRLALALVLSAHLGYDRGALVADSDVSRRLERCREVVAWLEAFLADTPTGAVADEASVMLEDLAGSVPGCVAARHEEDLSGGSQTNSEEPPHRRRSSSNEEL